MALLGIAAPARAAAPTVTITADRSAAVAGTTIEYDIDVTNGGNGDLIVTIYQAGAAPIEAPRAQNVNDAHFNFVLSLSVNTTVTAEIGGSTSSASVKIRPRIATQVRSGYLLSGRYHLIKAGTAPLFRSTSYPKRPGQMCLRHEVQRLRSVGWRTVHLSRCRLENTKGQVSWAWKGAHPKRVSFRVRGVFPGDSRNIPGPGSWTYFRFR